MEAQRKEKILERIVLDKEDKIFDAKKCHLVAETIGEEYNVCFPFGTTPMPNVGIEVHIFKWFPPNIVYNPFLNIHMGEIKKKIV